MRLGIKGKQVLGVTSIVGVVVVVLSVLHLSQLARVGLDESRARAELLANAVYHRAREVVNAGADPYQAMRNDPGLRSILESSLYSENVTFAAIADVRNVAVVHQDRSLEGHVLPPGDPLQKLLERRAFAQLLAIYSGQGKNLEFRQPLVLAPSNTEFGSIRIGISTLLIRDQLSLSLRPAVATAFAALAVAVLVATLLSQLLLRPIHVIRSGLTRLGRGEFGVRLDLNQQDEFGELGTFFNAVSEQLSADRSQMAGQVANLELAVQHLEDAVAILNPRGLLLFANPAMRALLPDVAVGASVDDLLPSDHPVRKLAALGRLSAGVAHEVKNPLNAMMIHLELLRQQFTSHRPAIGARAELASARGELTRGDIVEPRGAVATAPDLDPSEALQHVDVIAGEIKRLDEVVQGFLKFSRPEDLTLQPVSLGMLFDEIVPIVRPEADRLNVALAVECHDVPDVNGDPGMLRQAFLNLALNACQAMQHGGSLRIHCSAARGRRAAIAFTDSGVGIKPEHLQKIFNLYFTTKEKGSGIGLSMVYRTVQMHDGEIEVQSTPGKGTTFTVLLPQA